MILFLFSFVACEKILGVDFGSQYLKFGFADTDTSEYILDDLNQKYGIPTAFAIKTKKNSDSPLTNETLDGISIKYGKKAIKYLHKHPHHGSEYVLNSVVRNDPDFRTSTVVNQTTLMTLFFGQFLTQLKESPASISVALPSIFTPNMREQILDGLRFFNAPIKSITDDLQALSCLYADSYLNRYMSRLRKVLFVDVGFAYAKASVINFTFNGQYTLSTLMANTWSEKCGGFAFAKALSRSARIPIYSAEKMLKDVESDLDFAKSELAELNRIINETVEKGGLVDEVQIIGGASRYQFVYDAVTEAVKYAFLPPIPEKTKKSTNQTSFEKVEGKESENIASTGVFTNETNSTVNQVGPKVLREFDPSTAITLGTLHYILMTENRSMFMPTYMIRKPTASYYVRCGKIMQTFCQRNAMCKQPFFPNVDTCPNDTIELLIDSRQAPTGTSPIIAKIHMNNISSISFNESVPGHRGIVRMRLPDPFVEGIDWCNSSSECFPISYNDITIDKNDLVKQYEMFEAITTKLANDANKKSYLETIEKLIKKLGKIINPSENAESTLKVNGAIKEKFEALEKKLKDKEFEKLSIDQIREVRDDIKSLCLSLGMKVNE